MGAKSRPQTEGDRGAGRESRNEQLPEDTLTFTTCHWRGGGHRALPCVRRRRKVDGAPLLSLVFVVKQQEQPFAEMQTKQEGWRLELDL